MRSRTRAGGLWTAEPVIVSGPGPSRPPIAHACIAATKTYGFGG